MSKKVILKVTSLALAASMTLSLLAGCAAKTEGTTDTTKQTETTAQDNKTADAGEQAKPSADEPGWKGDTSPVTLDWYVNFSWYSNDWGNTIVSKLVEEKTGVKINFIIPAGNEAEKVNTMIAANSLPDIVTIGWWEEGVKRMIEGGLVHPLNELADKYDPYFYKVANEQTMNWYTKEDGNIYGYPNNSVAPSDYANYDKIASNQTFQVRKDIYEAIGKPDMRTPEGFLNALKAAKEQFPEVNGQPLIPIGFHEFGGTGNYGFHDYLGNAYLSNFLALPKEKDGKAYDQIEDPEMVRWLKVARKANEMGLISPDIFIDKRAQMEEKIAQGRYFAMMYQRTDFVVPQQTLYEQDPNTIYMAIDGPSNANLDPNRPSGPGIAGWTLSMISKNAKNPDRAIKFFSYWMSEEGQRDTFLGEKGVTWDVIDGKEQYLPEYADMKQNNKQEFDKVVGQDPMWMFNNDLIQMKWKPAPGPALRQLEEWTYGKATSYTVYDDINPPATSEEGIIHKKVADKWGTVLPKLILAPTEEEFDQLYQEFLDYKAAQGYDKVLEYQTKRIQENKVRIGME